MLLPSQKPLWRNSAFQLMWTSAAASGFGDKAVMLSALALLGAWGKAADTTGANAANQFCFFLPYILFSIPAGLLADKLPRRFIMMACDWGRGLILLRGVLWLSALAVAASPDLPPVGGQPLVGPDHQWKIFAVLLAVGACAAVFSPARYAVIPQIVGQQRVQLGNAIIGSIGVMAALIGAVLCGAYIDPEHPETIRRILLLTIGLYGAAGLAFAFMRLPRLHPHAAAGQPAASGIRYILRHRRTLQLNLLYLLVWGMAMLVFAAVPTVGKMNFNLEGQPLQATSTLLGAAMGAGMLLGAVFMSLLPTRRQGGILMTAFLVPTGLGMVVMALSPWMPLCFAAAFVCGFCGHASLISCVTLIQSTTPDHVLGRVMGLNSMLSTVGLVGVNLIVGLPEIAHQANLLGAHVDVSAVPPADRWMLTATWAAGLALAAMGAHCAIRHGTGGIMPTRIGNAFYRVTNFYALGWNRTVWIGRHLVPGGGPVILSMNHTAGPDPWLVQAGLNRMIRWLMLDKYMFRVLAPLWRAVDPIVIRQGERGSAQVRQMIAAVEQGGMVGIFPEGGLQRSRRVLQKFGGGVAVLAKKTGAPVVPVWIHGTPLSENLAWQMLIPSRCTVVFGKPLRCGPDEAEDVFLRRLRLVMLGLRAQVPADRRCYEEPDPEDVKLPAPAAAPTP